MDAFLSLHHISITFGGVHALRDVSLDITAGECHAFMGENGAGKSSLGKIIAGIHRPDRGTISIDGRPIAFASPRDAVHAGVGMVHQELSFCADLSVAENLAIGSYPRRMGFFLDTNDMIARARAKLQTIGADIDPLRPMRALTIAQQQLVQIAYALGAGARLIIFDEPTSALSEHESLRLRALIRDLQARGVTTIYISHRMDEVFDIADRLTVLRDGEAVLTATTGNVARNDVIRAMIGRELETYFPLHRNRRAGSERLRVEHVTVPGFGTNVSFNICAGEIVGLAGLIGAGRSETATAVFGLARRTSGRVLVDGRLLPPHSVRRAMRAGLALVPEDRRRQGMALNLGCRANFSISILRRLSRFGFIDRKAEIGLARRHFERLSVKTPTLDTPVSHLSGGNQQKIVLAKWLATDASVLIVDEPTRGIDIGAKQAIHSLLDELASAGMAILLISSELPELLALSTRILVMRDGKITGEVRREDADQAAIFRMMAGVEHNASL